MAQILAEVAGEASPACRGAAPAVAGRLARLAPYALLAGLPLLLFAANPSWVYSQPGTIDPWIYQGFFRALPDYQSRLFPGTYYGSRLSWVLPGYCAYRLLPPFAANLALHLGVFYLAVFSFYSLAARTVSRRAALLGAVLLGCNPLILQEVGGDYVDGVGVAYALLALALLARAPAGASQA
jgi:hypothetical protein